MAETGEFRFEIADFTPMTLPMKRLQEYLPHLVEVFGSYDDVHLIRVDEGSAAPLIFPKDRVITKVAKRLFSLKSGSGSRKAYRAMDAINELLVEDNTSATLRSPHFGIVIEFPGVKENKDPQIGPITEPGELQGELFQVGGRDETISIHLRSQSGELFICTGTREQGRDISQHLFKPVRVRGNGRWVRRENGKWKLVSFILDDFKLLKDTGLAQAVDGLRELGRKFDVKPDLLLLDEDD